MTVCYFLQTHHRPEQIYRLIRTIRRQSPASLILVAHDPAFGPLDPAPVADVARVTLLTREAPATRGVFAGFQPYLDAVEWLVRGEVDFDWLVYLSGEDYPIRPLSELEAHLATTDVDGFMPYWNALSAEGLWGRSKRGHRRYYFHYVRPPRWVGAALRLFRPLNDLQSLVHLHCTYGVYAGVRARRRPFTAAFPCLVGHTFHVLSCRAVTFLQATLAANPDLVDYYRHTVAPSESVVQTLLVNSGRFRFSAEPFRFIDYAGRRDGHARALTCDDLPMLIEGGYFLGRRFDLDVDAQVLDRLDELLARAVGRTAR